MPCGALVEDHFNPDDGPDRQTRPRRLWRHRAVVVALGSEPESLYVVQTGTPVADVIEALELRSPSQASMPSASSPSASES
jgi:hypothetical protein